MTTTPTKITLNQSQGIPFNKLTLSQANVRRIKAGLSIEELAEDIARRGLLQSLNVRSVLDADGADTGLFEVPAGGRRFRALQLLVKQKRMAKTQPVPCIVSSGGTAEEDSLAENVQRVALHPLDQFRAFQTLREQGQGEEEIAARFFVTPAVVRQRLKLAAVSPKLLDLYAEDELRLEQLMAFTVNGDHARQEQVWDAIRQTHNTSAHGIRQRLTEGAIAASDKRARFVGLETYEQAGGTILRDLFDENCDGWLQDPALLDRLATERLQGEAEALREEGWKWIAVATDFPYGHTRGLRALVGETDLLTPDEQESYDTLRAEYENLQAEYEELDEYPEEVDQRLGEIEGLLEAFENRPKRYDPDEVARAGVFVSIDREGALQIERGFVRPEDEAPTQPAPVDDESVPENPGTRAALDPVARTTVIMVGGAAPTGEAETSDEEDGLKPLPDRLVAELTAHRTLALREALGRDPDMAFLAVLHALCLTTFYRYSAYTCLEITACSAGFSMQPPGLKDSAVARAIDARHSQWERQLPEEPDQLWETLIALDGDSRAALFAHCAGLSVNAVHEPWNRNPARIAHADRVVRAVGLDMVTAGWSPTVETYLGRVTKAHILEAVREAKGDASVELIEHLKKPEMAREAERLLAGTGWLPEPLRDPNGITAVDSSQAMTEPEALPAFLDMDTEDEAVDADHIEALAAE